MYKYDGPWGDVTVLMHHMQRLTNPLITLNTEEEVLTFLDNGDKEVIQDDFKGGIVGKGTNFDPKKAINGYLKDMGFNTRVVAFFYDKSEYKEEIEILRNTATYLSARYNLRVGIVTDRRLVMQMKNDKILGYFFANGMTT